MPMRRITSSETCTAHVGDLKEFATVTCGDGQVESIGAVLCREA